MINFINDQWLLIITELMIMWIFWIGLSETACINYPTDLDMEFPRRSNTNYSRDITGLSNALVVSKVFYVLTAFLIPHSVQSMQTHEERKHKKQRTENAQLWQRRLVRECAALHVHCKGPLFIL